MGEPIQLTTVSTADEVRGILELQADNLASALSPEETAEYGFVTVRHDFPVLWRMNEATPAIVAKAGERVVAYALAMPRVFSRDVPILQPLFAMLDALSWEGTPLRDNPRWFVMGQVCVADGYRGIGIFDAMYRLMAATYGDRFDLIVTEVAARNTRSLRAHARAGFQPLHIYADPATGEDWHVIALDIRGASG